ncbi:MAG: aldose epimerase family protein [Opitutales bacterium]
MKIERNDFGKTNDDLPVDLYTLTNDQGMQVAITNFGGIITSLSVPDRTGNPEEVVLGFDSLSDYLSGSPYFGAVIGRYGNRIADGKFTLDEADYALATNDGPNHLHGGTRGFDKVLWQAEAFVVDNEVGLRLRYISEDMEEGYPGKLSVEVVYTLTNNNELKIDYTATTDQPTIVNLTNHSYFNLSGDTTRNILDHELMINGTSFLPVNRHQIPEGEIRAVEGTPLDFRSPRKVGERIDADDDQIRFCRGYDHTWVLGGAGEMKLAATVRDAQSGRLMEVWTTEPGVQFYSGNFLNGKVVGKGGKAYEKRDGLCLETQHFPDSPNQPDFPSTVLRPGETYRSQTIHRFSIR